ncbi:MAG: hypothetical protein Q8880_12785 [Bacteroidota bacterium]|nr:hypothetical protein [Bacteroidota bacterium]
MGNDLDNKVKDAIDQANSAHAAADYARKKPTGLFEKKDAIETIQSALYDLAGAVGSGAEAQKVSFEFQTQLAEITKYLFGLGVSNLALNRSVVRELELKLSDASAEELSDLARQETLNVIRQLKAQEDILIKQEQLDKKIKIVHDENVRLGKQIEAQIEIDTRHDGELQVLASTDKLFTEELKAQAETDRKHIEILTSLARREEEHDKAIAALKSEFSSSFTDISKKLSRKLIVSYTIGGAGVFIGIFALLLILFT